jgi:hypothetical protein
MLFLGSVASSGWDLLTSLHGQQPAHSGAAAGGAGAGPFATDGAMGQTTPASAPAPAPPLGAANVQNPLSPNVLGFLIWNQSQQSGAAAAAGDAGIGGATGTNGATGASTPFQSALFNKLDGNGDGTISQSEFDAAVGANGNSGAAGALLSKIDANGDGSIDPNELAAATRNNGSRGRHHHHHHGGFAALSQSGGSDPLANLLGTSSQGASSATATNADGSSTTTITYADGYKVALTTPVQAPAAAPTATPSATPPVASSNNILESLIQLQAQLLTPAAKA